MTININVKNLASSGNKVVDCPVDLFLARPLDEEENVAINILTVSYSLWCQFGGLVAIDAPFTCLLIVPFNMTLTIRRAGLYISQHR